MLYLFGFLFALQLVVGQTLYKYAVDKVNFEPTLSFLLSKQMLQFVGSWQFIAGVLFYLSATILNFWMLTRFDFSSIQAVAVPLVLALSFIVGGWLFGDHISAVNVAGFCLLVVGIVLATIR